MSKTVASDPDCTIAPGDGIELVRLPGIEWYVVSVAKVEYDEGPPRFLLSLANHEC